MRARAGMRAMAGSAHARRRAARRAARQALTSTTALVSVRSASLYPLPAASTRLCVASQLSCTKSQMWYRPMSLYDLKPCSSTRESAVHSCPRTSTAISLFFWSLPSVSTDLVEPAALAWA